jgi:DNA helicase-2/ATP-dependent DNA helicase PcrA
MKRFEELLDSLNPPQREAVDTLSGPLLILAGAGSGKTRVLTFRTANLIAQGLAAAEEILAVTFTNKAAKEMEARISGLLREIGALAPGRLWISTFHSICARLLREHIHLLDYQPFFGIYDSADQLAMVKKAATTLNLDEKSYPAKQFQARINSAKTEGLLPADVKKRPHWMDARSLAVYERYDADMKRANALDFGDLLLKTYELFQLYPAVLEALQARFKYLMVDEYQDTNRIQYLLVQKLAQAHGNLCVVGDEDQSIYSWRGADIANILSFEKDFPECKVIKLEQNYRSTQTIVDAASSVIKRNSQRKDKTLFTQNGAGEPIAVREENNEYDEARFVAQSIERSLGEGDLAYRDVAIFYRTNAQSRVLEEQFRARNIPYRIVGGVKFYERMEIKDVLGYMKLCLNPTDDIAFKRIVNVPARGIGKATVDRLEELAATMGAPILEASGAAIERRELGAGAARKLRDFLALFESLREKAATLPLPEFYHAILDATQYAQRLKQEGTPEADSRVENLEEFDNAIGRFAEERGSEATLQSFLEEMSLVSDADEMQDSDNAVTMMTLHISKGLEFPSVYVVGLEEGLFPSARATEGESNASALEEERRLMYVGMTRARRTLALTYARMRKVWGSEQMNPPSRFLAEIPKEYARFSSAVTRPRLAGGGAAFPGMSADSFAGLRRGYGTGFAAGAGSSSGPGRGGSAKSGLGKHFSFGEQPPSYEDFGDDSFDPEDAPGEPVFQKGMRVRHPTYGVGAVFQTEGSGPDLKVSVVFGDNTIKKFVAKYARLERA